MAQVPNTFEILKFNFKNLGKKLNTTNNPKSSSQKLPENDIATVNLVFWNDGFTIGNGPLRPYDDREGLRLLENLRNGYHQSNFTEKKFL